MTSRGGDAGSTGVAADVAADGRRIRVAKGHGTENDFVLLADPDANLLGERVPADIVRFLCDRRAGIGADGVLRMVAPGVLDRYAEAGTGGDPGPLDAVMDFYNADGSTGTMCGNGVRVFAAYLDAHPELRAGSTDKNSADDVLVIGTGAGAKHVVRLLGGDYRVDMGTPGLPPGGAGLVVSANGRTWPATAVDMGNDHAVCVVDSLDDPGPLFEQPVWEPRSVFPDGVNIEFVVRSGPQAFALRVHERGVGETRSCGTGVCAAVAALTGPGAVADGSTDAVTAALDRIGKVDGGTDGASDSGPQLDAYTVDVPGGRLTVARTPDGRLLMTGPAVIVYETEVTLPVAARPAAAGTESGGRRLTVVEA